MENPILMGNVREVPREGSLLPDTSAQASPAGSRASR